MSWIENNSVRELRKEGKTDGSEQRQQGGFTAGDLAPLKALRLSEFLGTEPIVIVFAIEGMLKKGCLYALVGRTGSAKTATAIYQAICLASGFHFFDRECIEMPVLYVAAENPDEVKARMRLQIEAFARWLGTFWTLEQVTGWRKKLEMNLMVVPRSFMLKQKQYELHGIINEHKIGAVFVDTDSAVSVGGDGNDNDNSERMEHARDLRTITRLPSLPVVIDLCHPAGTNKTVENPFPRGGSAFANEIDGVMNQTRKGDTATLRSHPEKFRGEEFEMKLKTEMVSSHMVVDHKGNWIKYPVVRPSVGVQSDPSEATTAAKAAAEGLKAALLNKEDDKAIWNFINGKVMKGERISRKGVEGHRNTIRAGMTVEAARDAMNRLISDGRVVEEGKTRNATLRAVELAPGGGY